MYTSLHTHIYVPSTLRIWDINHTKKQIQVIKARDKQGTGLQIPICMYLQTVCNYSAGTINYMYMYM